jgi:aryl-alcohol dehydrogenase-like predicted oxidoreductase
VEYRRLGSSDLLVSEIALGSWLTFGGGIPDRSAKELVDAAFDLGVTLFDTANIYYRGAAEELLGTALQGRRRDSYVLATKLYYPMSDSDRGLSRDQIFKQLDASLRRLRVDFVDLYQCHRYDHQTPLAETMEALTEVVRQGKARYVGFSEWLPEEIQASLELPDVERFVSSQPQYSMLWRRPEQGVFDICAANGISQIVWSPLAQGVLTGKYRAGEPPAADSRARSSRMGWSMGSFLAPDVLRAVDRLRPIAAGVGLTLSQLALAWVLRQPNVAAAIVGGSRPDQLRENAAAAGVALDDETLVAIDAALAGVIER